MAQPAPKTHNFPERSAERFSIQARLGGGGVGEVFLAEDRLLKRQVAMKALLPERCQGTGSHDRLLTEAERASQLTDEHIARIYDIVEHDGRAFLIMEYVEGETLRARLGRPLPSADFFSIAEQCLTGLAAAHRSGILHCDLKPENLMITPAGGVKILDFGFARRARMESTTDNSGLSSPAIAGTLAYMAPEVLMGETPDRRADIFSLGVVFYEALTGLHPFRDSHAMGTVAHILHESPHAFPGPIPAGLDHVITRMLAKDPAQRYQTCEDVLADLRAVH
ncbi:MAG TPA: serine/threonine-protein kinase, partial [Candidatus Limnocylindrales bacterium]|nr:serine/threonine-protein kinase [Candidatus Limnocylindrales bacterium]